LVTLSKRNVISVKQVDDVFSGSMPGITTAENAGQRMQQQAVSTIEQVRHLQARLWVYGNLLMLQSLLSDPVPLEKSKEVLHDFFKVWILRLKCFIIRAHRSVLNVCHESFGENLKCGAMAGQDVVVVEAEHLLDTIQAMMDVLRSVAVDANQTLRLITESDDPLH
jgi:hypothetical protein